METTTETKATDRSILRPRSLLWVFTLPVVLIVLDALLGDSSPRLLDVPGTYFGTGSRNIDGTVLDLTGLINHSVEWLKDTAIVFGWTFKDMFRWFASRLDFPLEFMENLMTGNAIIGFSLPISAAVGAVALTASAIWRRGRTLTILALGAFSYLAAFNIWGQSDTLLAMPWVVMVGLFGSLGWYLGGRGLGVMSASIIAYMALFNIWEASMITLSTILVAAPLTGLVGMILGIAAAKKERLENLIRPVLNLMQSTPHLSYMILIITFVGISHKAGIVASMVFAMPPMTRLTILGIKSIPNEVIEAAVMAGADPRQMLTKVELPSARSSILLGANQTFIQFFGMVVLASLVGTRGLGFELLQYLRQLRFGEALVLGVSIVLMAILLDRLTRAAAHKEPQRVDPKSFIQDNRFALSGLAVVVGGYAASIVSNSLRLWPEAWSFRWADGIDGFIKGFMVRHISGPLQDLTDPIVIYILNPVRLFFEGLPWVALAMLVVLLARRNGKWVSPVTVGLLVTYVAFAGYWPRTMVSVYLVATVVMLGVVIGVPVGIFGASSARRSRVANTILDILQTAPSFLYILPVIMLVRIGDRATIIAMFVFTAVPAVRYTIHGLLAVPHDRIEAAITSGATPWQTLWKVRLPLAFPEVMLGVNQSINFGLFMLMIAGYIGGTSDLGPELFKALTHLDAGKGLVVGFCIAAIGLVADTIITGWAAERKRILGIS